MIPLGSNNFLILFINSMLVWSLLYPSALVFAYPMPCSAETEPLYEATPSSILVASTSRKELLTDKLEHEWFESGRVLRGICGCDNVDMEVT